VSFGYIQKCYGVLAQLGQRVEYTGDLRKTRRGTIVGFHSQYLRIKFDDEDNRHTGVFNPTYGMRYLTDETPKAT
jgi:hypothetical protein